MHLVWVVKYNRRIGYLRMAANLSLVHGLIRTMHLDGLQQREIPGCAMNHLIAFVH